MGQPARDKSADAEMMVLFQQLPPAVRKGLRISHLKAATGMILIKDRVRTYFQEVARMETTLKRFKREHGYCAGRPNCLAYVGAVDDKDKKQQPSLCARCQKEMDRIRRGDTRKTTHSAYGIMRMQERKEEREDREREVRRLKAGQP